MWPNPQFPVDLVTFTEEILHGKLHSLCSDTNANANTMIIFIIKDTKLHVPVVTLKHNKNNLKKCEKVLAKELKGQFTSMNIKQKVR